MIKFGRKKDVSRNPVGRRQPVVPPSGSSTVFSYHSNRNREGMPIRQPQSAAVGERDRRANREWVRNIPSLIALVVVAVSLLYCFSLDTSPKIVVAGSSPSDVAPLRSKGEYQQGAATLLNKSFLNHSKLTVNTNKFVADFTTQYPEISDVSVSLPIIGRRPVMIIETAKPAMIMATPTKTVVVDTRGKAIMQSNELTSSVRNALPVVTDESGAPTDIGKTIVSSQDVAFIQGVLAQLKAKNIGVERVTLPEIAREVHVKIADKPYFVKFNLNTDPRIATGTFIAAKEKLEKDNVTPAEYFDARIEERAYYK